MQLRLLFWSLRNRRGRHLLNALATAVAVAVVMVFISTLFVFVKYSRSVSDTELVRILVVPKLILPGSFTDGMPVTLKSSLEKIAGVKEVERKLVFSGAHEASGATYVVVGEDDTTIEMNKDFYPVDAATLAAWKKGRSIDAIVTENTARDLRLEVGKAVEVPTTYGPMQINVIGISKGALFKNVIVIHFAYAQQVAKNTETCGYRIFAPPADLDHVVTEVAALTRNTSMPAQGVDSSRFRAVGAKNLATIPVVLGFLGLFLVFTTGLTLANNSAISIRERRIEVATLRVIGFYPMTLLRLLVSEAIVVGLAGGLFSVATVYLLFHHVVTLTPKWMPSPTLGVFPIAVGLGIAVIVPLIGALPSALAAVRVKLVDGLQQTA